MKIPRGLSIVSMFFIIISVLMDGCAQTTTETTIATLTTKTAQPVNGLQLQVSVNTSTLAPGEPLQINVSEYNTLPRTIMSPQQRIGELTALHRSLPNINLLPFGVAVFRGHYDAGNISQGLRYHYLQQFLVYHNQIDNWV